MLSVSIFALSIITIMITSVGVRKFISTRKNKLPGGLTIDQLPFLHDVGNPGETVNSKYMKTIKNYDDGDSYQIYFVESFGQNLPFPKGKEGYAKLKLV